MTKNDGIEIFTAGNGFIVRRGRWDGDGFGIVRDAFVFETRAALLAYLRRHFDESQPPKVTQAKGAA